MLIPSFGDLGVGVFSRNIFRKWTNRARNNIEIRGCGGGCAKDFGRRRGRQCVLPLMQRKHPSWMLRCVLPHLRNLFRHLSEIRRLAGFLVLCVVFLGVYAACGSDSAVLPQPHRRMIGRLNPRRAARSDHGSQITQSGQDE